MTRPEKRLTSAELILLAAGDLTNSGSAEFSEWQLSIAAWKRDLNRFGMRGYEKDHPDHKRVMKEVMGKANSNPLQRGLLEKPRPNIYHLTALGRSEIAALGARYKLGGEQPRSASQLYEDIARYTKHRVFLAWIKDPEEPRSWLGASAFLGLTRHDPVELNYRVRDPLRFAADGLAWCDENARDRLTPGPVGGGKAITRRDLEMLRDFVGVLETRFANQMGAIRRRGEQPMAR
jgi:hypothetical protein